MAGCSLYTQSSRQDDNCISPVVGEKSRGGIPWACECSSALPPIEQDKQKLFDVWTTHTQHCSVCQDALKNINRLAVLANVAAIVCLCLAVIVDSRTVAMKAVVAGEGTSLLTTPPIQFWWAIGGAVLFAMLGYLLKKLKRLFYIYEFEHTQND